MSNKANKPLLRDIADRVRSPMAALRMLSGTFRARVADALGSATELQKQRESVHADRKAMKGLIAGHEAELRKSRETTRSLLKDFNERLEMVTRHSRELAGEHKAALDLKARHTKLDEKEQWLEQLSVDLAEQQAQAQALFKSLEERVRETAERQSAALDLQESLTLTNTSSQELAEKLAQEGRELQTRTEALKDTHVELETGRAQLERRAQELEKSEAEASQRARDLLQAAESRGAALDARQKKFQTREAALEESRSRLEKVHETLASTQADVESLERRAQETQELLGRRGQELAVQEARLGKREKAVENWRTQAELRERTVQQRYDELESLESKKSEVRAQIAVLEKEHAARIAASDKELERHRQTLAESRDEAVRARDLYQRELLRLEQRKTKIETSTRKHAQAVADLEAKTQDLAQREERIRILEAQVTHMREQQLEMRGVIASLTAMAGDERVRGEPAPGHRDGNGNGSGNGDGPVVDRASSPTASSSDRKGHEHNGAESR